MLLILGVVSLAAKADSWAPPVDQEYRSASRQFVFKVGVPEASALGRVRSTGSLWRTQAEGEVRLWRQALVNDVAPVNALVHDSGRFVVTFDEWHRIGLNPVVIYGTNGMLVARLSLEDLGLGELHPRIARSVSSVWWNQSAILLFGPPASDTRERWRVALEETLFIRLHWDQLIIIDLARGRVIDAGDARGLTAADARALAAESAAYLDTTFRRLARDYLVEKNFEPDPSGDGTLGILLAKQLHLQEALPRLKRLAEIERFQHWAAPPWSDHPEENNLLGLIRATVKEIEGPASVHKDGSPKAP